MYDKTFDLGSGWLAPLNPVSNDDDDEDEDDHEENPVTTPASSYLNDSKSILKQFLTKLYLSSFNYPLQTNGQLFRRSI